MTPIGFKNKPNTENVKQGSNPRVTRDMFKAYTMQRTELFEKTKEVKFAGWKGLNTAALVLLWSNSPWYLWGIPESQEWFLWIRILSRLHCFAGNAPRRERQFAVFVLEAFAFRSKTKAFPPRDSSPASDQDTCWRFRTCRAFRRRRRWASRSRPEPSSTVCRVRPSPGDPAILKCRSKLCSTPDANMALFWGRNASVRNQVRQGFLSCGSVFSDSFYWQAKVYCSFWYIFTCHLIGNTAVHISRCLPCKKKLSWKGNNLKTLTNQGNNILVLQEKSLCWWNGQEKYHADNHIYLWR